MSGAGEPFVCSLCGYEGKKAVSDEEARAEAAALFGAPVPDEEVKVVCDDCYRAFLAWFETLTPADHAAIAAGTYPREKLFHGRRR